jgi:hypothetical protein
VCVFRNVGTGQKNIKTKTKQKIPLRHCLLDDAPKFWQKAASLVVLSPLSFSAPIHHHLEDTVPPDSSSLETGLPDFSWCIIPKRGKYIPKYHKLYQMATKYTKLPQNIPNCNKIYQIATKYTKLPQNIPNCHKIYLTKYTKWPQNIPNEHNIYQMAVK